MVVIDSARLRNFDSEFAMMRAWIANISRHPPSCGSGYKAGGSRRASDLFQNQATKVAGKAKSRACIVLLV